MTKKKGRPQIEGRLKQIPGVEPLGRTAEDQTATGPEETVETFVHTLWLAEEDRVIQRIQVVKERQQVVDFSLQHETYCHKEWVPVGRADSSHPDRGPHYHRYDRLGREDERSLAADPDEAYDEAYPQVVDGWEENKRRWKRGLDGG